MTAYRPLIEAAAAAHGLDPLVVETIVLIESSGHADAFRFEPAYFDVNDPLLQQAPYSVYEQAGQRRRISSSYGLVQIMFPTAVEMGFTGAPELLFVPETNLDLGCKYFASLLKHAVGDLTKAFASYNGSGPAAHAYAVDAMKQLATLQAEPKA